MNKGNITILSGGSGNTAIINALLPNKDINLQIITNAYDSGKSTGICRKITNTLGVSDIRKNHFKIYKNLHKDDLNDNLVKFYKERLNLTKGNELEEVKEFLNNNNLSNLIQYAEEFFKREEANKYDYNDFSIANIIYSEMYAEIGYDKTNDYFTDLLEIPRCVKINSFDNVYINAITYNNNIISDEGDIVEYKNSEDKIKDIIYTDIDKSEGINSEVIDIINNSDYIIISTGTFWSSIYPTLHYLDFYKLINNSNAKKIWIINTEEDKDSYGVSSNMFINRLEELGLDLSNFIIIENLDAIDSLKEKNEKHNIIYEHLGNINGLNESDLLKEVFNKIE